MRISNQANGVTVKAYAGTTGVLLAMNIEDSRRSGLLGFAIERKWKKKDENTKQMIDQKGWLINGLCFDGVALETPYFSNRAPIQKFRWLDYSVYPDTEYTYIIYAAYGEPVNPSLLEGPAVTVKTHSIEIGQKHQVVFNRAVAASQAFARKFGEIKPNAQSTDDVIRKEEEEKKLNGTNKQKVELQSEEERLKAENALKWLARGLLDKILEFIGRAENENWALDIAIYEYELKTIIDAVEKALKLEEEAGKEQNKAPTIRIIYHSKPGDEQTMVNERSLERFPADWKRPRVTNNIFHHKFIVLSKKVNGSYEPQAVLCGSTNFTENGIYRQANVVHIVEDSEIAKQYEGIFETLWNGPQDVKKYIDTNNAYGPDFSTKDIFVGFSPRSGKKRPKKLLDLEEFKKIIEHAERDVLFCTAFDLDASIEEALSGRPRDSVLRYGLQNSGGSIKGTHADCTQSFVTAALLPEGLEGWLGESTAGQRGNILIHTKMVITDFTSNSPTVISGSHNLSSNASMGNDENVLIIRNNTDVADIYGCELMRLYDHYRFRYKVTRSAKARQAAQAALETAVKAQTEQSPENARKAKKPEQMAKKALDAAVDAAKDAVEFAQGSSLLAAIAAKEAQAAVKIAGTNNLEKAREAATNALTASGEADIAAQKAMEKQAAVLKAAEEAETAQSLATLLEKTLETAKLAVEAADFAVVADSKVKQRRLSLCADDSWTDEYFIDAKDKSLKAKKSKALKVRDRECFSGATVTPYDELIK
jgi:phosphatidylserine/phosphatidylglycerophosphate/cardiolipin synthase-like enzyme